MSKAAGPGLCKNGPNGEIEKEVIALSKEYRIATPYTSFLVLESEAAYDQRGIDRKGNAYKPPTPTVQAPSPPSATGKVTVPGRDEPGLFFPEAKESDHNESADAGKPVKSAAGISMNPNLPCSRVND